MRITENKDEKGKKMKTYKDLVFQPHMLAKEILEMKEKDFFTPWFAVNKDAKHAVLCFDNGYGISVIKDAPLITFGAKYECAVLKGTAEKYELIYPDFAEDVVRCNTEEEINELMAQIQKMEHADGK